MLMVGENIQRAREQLQNIKGMFTMGQGRFIDKLLSPNPGILAKFPMGQRVSERMQSIRGMGLRTKAPGVTTVGQFGAYQEPPAVSSTKFVSV